VLTVPAPINAKRLAESLLGRTLPTPSRGNDNTILRVEGSNAIVATDESPGGEPVALNKLQQGLDLLFTEGQVRITPETFGGYRRSSAIGAVLAALPATQVTAQPTHVGLASQTPLRDQLIEACELVTQPRAADDVVAADDLHQLMVHGLAATLRALVAEPTGYKVQGSAGQVNFPWAETPWVAVFDRLVTESAQQGHYVVYLIHKDGSGVSLSLMQGVTQVRASAGASRTAVLKAQATRFRGYLAAKAINDLILGEIDLAGTADRTRRYAAASIVAKFYPADAIPHDAALALDLRRFLALYAATTEGIDQEEAAAAADVPDEAKTGTEAKRYRWHLRAEGRNRTVVRKAKELRNYTCQVCQRAFVEAYGEIGKRCIDAHHLTPFGDLDERPRDLNPAVDFAVVCSNCHRLLHSETPPLEPAQLVTLLDPPAATA